MRIFDEASANEVKAEERVYETWVKDRKNAILAMSDTRKKQAEWQKLFPPYTQDDSFLESNSGVW